MSRFRSAFYPKQRVVCEQTNIQDPHYHRKGKRLTVYKVKVYPDSRYGLLFRSTFDEGLEYYQDADRYRPLTPAELQEES